MRDLTEIDFFIDKIEYSGHRFIDYNEQLNDFNEEKLKTIALYSESVHKIVFNETKKKRTRRKAHARTGRRGRKDAQPYHHRGARGRGLQR